MGNLKGRIEAILFVAGEAVPVKELARALQTGEKEVREAIDSLKDEYDYREFFKNLELITLAESLGGVESLACHPASMTHAAIPADIRKEVGIVDELIRFSVGIEDADDLIADLEQSILKSKK